MNHGSVAKALLSWMLWMPIGAGAAFLGMPVAIKMLGQRWDRGFSLWQVYVISAFAILIMSMLLVGMSGRLGVLLIYSKERVFGGLCGLLSIVAFASYVSCALNEWIVGNLEDTRANTVTSAILGALLGPVMGLVVKRVFASRHA